jgi:cell division transport system ATP-binding protein
MIKFENITKNYSSREPILQDVTFEIKRGEFVSIVGKSGAGKTTLVRLILGLENPTSGEIYFDGVNVSNADNLKIQEIRRKVGCIYQDYKLLPKKTVYENVAYIMQVEGKENEEIER